MATNNFFQNYHYFNEQQLIDDLVIEAIQIYGVDTWYVSRVTPNIDHIMNEDRQSIFDQAYQMEMYVKSVDGFQGDGDFLSRFGLQIRDQAVFSLAFRTFEKYATRKNASLKRPFEGDLIYMPMNKKFFEITFVEHESVFYQTGALQVYDLKCELFEFSNERFQTGIPEIDNFYNNIRTDDVSSLEELFDVDPIAKNIFFEDEANTFIDFSQIDPFKEDIQVPTDREATFDSTIITMDNSQI